MEKNLLELESKENDLILYCKAAIGTIRGSLENLRHLVLENGFVSDEEEIFFFKKVKRTILQQLIYYSELLMIESCRPPGTRNSMCVTIT